MPDHQYDLNGFFSGCQPLYCAYRITYLKNNTWKIAQSEEDLKTFIGNVDNEYETYLIGEINDYSIDANSEKGNGYRKIRNGFKIKMMKYDNCPQSKESYTFFVGNDGTITNVKSLGFYF